MSNPLTQMELVMQFYKMNPYRDIKHVEAVDWITAEWQKQTGGVFRDPDRAIRSLHQKGLLLKIATGVYRYDPRFAEDKEFLNFTAQQKEEIKKKYNYRCALCGRGEEEGLAIHVDHIKPRELGGTSDTSNGQILCSKHNNMKKTLKQTETGKKMFIALYELAKKEEDKGLEKFVTEILTTYEKHNINDHIKWKK